jgi:TolA-binding protein
MKFRTVGLYLFILLLIFLHKYNGNAQVQSDCTTALQDYQVALQSYEDGLLDPAIAGFESYLQKCPEAEQAPQAHYLLGEIFYKHQRFTDALHQATQAISTQMQSTIRPHALLLAAQCARQLKQAEQAEAYLQQILTSDEAAEVLPAALYWLGELASQDKRYEMARTYYQRVIEEQLTGAYATHAQYALGWLYRQLDNAPAALQAFSAFLALAPDHEFALQARFARAALLRETEQLSDAAEALKQLVQEAPVGLQDEALFWWAETTYQLGDYAEAGVVYQRLVSEYPQSTRVNASLYGWGWSEVKQHQCAAAVQPWETLLQRAPQLPQALEVHYQLGVCYIELGQSVSARQHLQEMVEAKQNTVQRQDALLKLASLAFQEEVYPEAIRYYTLALAFANSEERHRLHYLLGESYAALGTLTPAIEHWQQAFAGLPIQPLRAHALFRIGSAYMAQRTWLRAISIFRQLWDDFPAFAQRTAVATSLVQAYRETQQCVEALPFYDTVINAATEPRDRQLLVGAKARCLFEAEQYADVVQLLAPYFPSATDRFVAPQVLYILGQAYMQLQQEGEALKPLAFLRQQFPDHILTITAEPLLARLLERHEQRGEALAVWKAFLQRGTVSAGEELARLHLHVGQLAFKEGEFADVLDFMAPVRGSASSVLAAEALFWSGEAYFQQQQWDLALQVYQELLDRYQAERHWNTLARLRLGTIYEHHHDWQEALRAYQAVLATTTDGEVRANVRQRIVAIEAGRVLKPRPSPRTPSEG